MSLDLEDHAGRGYAAKVGTDTSLAVEIVETGPTLSAIVGTRVFDIDVNDHVQVDGRRVAVTIETEQERAAATAARAGGGRKADAIIKSPMPGRVVKVLVEAGTQVKPGTPLIVIEAMKMENELRAKAEGTVGVVHVKTGATVEANATLITMA